MDGYGCMDEWKPTLVGSVTGMVVGLVAITPGAGYVPIWASIIIGLVGSPICYLMISKVKQKLGYDDALDALDVMVLAVSGVVLRLDCLHKRLLTMLPDGMVCSLEIHNYS